MPARAAYPLLGLVSVPEQSSITPCDSSSFGRTVSASGRYAVHVTAANDAAPGLDQNSSPDVYRRDLVTGTTERVSVDDAGTAHNRPAIAYAISGDGEHVLFGSQAQLTDDGANCFANDFLFSGCFYVRDLDTGHTGRVDVATDGTPADSGGAFNSLPDISDHGRFVVFGSKATNLVAGDTNYTDDVFVRDRDTDANGIMEEAGATKTVRISVTVAGDEVSDLGQVGPTAIAGDGSVAAFASYSSTPVANDVNTGLDIFVKNLTTGGLQRFGRLPDDGAPQDTSCCGNFPVTINDNGTKLLFTGIANVPLPPPDVGAHGVGNVYVADVHSANVDLAYDASYDPDESAAAAGISGDGALVTFLSSGQLTAADTNATRSRDPRPFARPAPRD